MAHPVRPSDGTRPSDPKDLVFEGDRETPSAIRKAHRFQPKAFALSVAISALCVCLHYQISQHPFELIRVVLPDLLYYATFGLTFSVVLSLSYRLLRR